MSTTIYYFTGTGNSLHVARTIAEQLGECNIINIAKVKDNITIQDMSDTVGIVFPIFYRNMPNIVRDFVKKLRLDPAAYVFSVATYGGKQNGTFQSLDTLLVKKGMHLSAGFTLKMPGNAYIGKNFITPPEKRDILLKTSDETLKCIIENVKRREKTGFEPMPVLLSNISWYLGITYAEKIYRLPKKFNVTDKCNACGTCVRICPVGNIAQDGKKVTWGDHCTHCMACFHWCPKTAIQIGSKTADIARYHHPAIKVNDMIK